MTPLKLLIVIRHGHAVEAQDDYVRVLSTRGINEVRSTCRALEGAGTRIDHIVTSSAPRAAATAQEVATHFRFESALEQVRGLYLAPAPILLDAVTRTNDSVHTLVLVGHNPGLSTFVEQLTGTRTELFTGEARRIAFDVDSWAQATWGLGRELPPLTA